MGLSLQQRAVAWGHTVETDANVSPTHGPLVCFLPAHASLWAVGTLLGLCPTHPCP